MHEKRVITNQVELQVRDDEWDGQSIIFLHFSGANLMMWQRVVPFFQHRYRLILVDLRGHGKSSQPQTGYHMDEMACDVIGVMQELNIGKAHVIGSSLGAEVGLSLAANYPHQVLSLVCDGALSSEYGPYGTWQGSQAEFDDHVAGFLDKIRNSTEQVYPTLDALVARQRESLEPIGWWNDCVEEMVGYGACQLESGEFTSSFRKYARVDYFQHYFSYRLEDYYSRIPCPILMVPGEDVFGSDLERKAMEGLCSLAPAARIVKVDGWEHPYGWLLDPGAMCQVILEHLQGI